jgi:hypothetical protein
VCRVETPKLKRATGASDREPRPRFRRFRVVDSVRFVRFNIALPSHPPAWGGRKVGGDSEHGGTVVWAAGRDRPEIKGRPSQRDPIEDEVASVPGPDFFGQGSRFVRLPIPSDRRATRPAIVAVDGGTTG